LNLPAAPDPPVTLQTLLDTLPQTGLVSWIGIRPRRGQQITMLREIAADSERGLNGDHYAGRNAKRQVTLIQTEHLQVLASLLGRESIEPALLRRNIAVSGINLLALKNKQFRIGNTLLEMTGLCHPCSKMERALGAGGYNAMRGHGGITARIIVSGMIRCNDPVRMEA
jgi:MOSC domain-containing protein YiiM